MDAEALVIVMSLITGASGLISWWVGRASAARRRQLTARVQAGQVLAYLTDPSGPTPQPSALCVVDNRAPEPIRDVVLRCENTDLLALPEVPAGAQERHVVAVRLTAPTSSTYLNAHTAVAFSDKQGQRWTSDAAGLRLSDESPDAADRRKLASVPATWLVLASTLAGLIALALPLCVLVLIR